MGLVTRRRWLAMAGTVGLGLAVSANPARADRFGDWLSGVRADARA